MLHINSTKIRYRFLIETDKIVYRYQCIVRVFSCIGVHLVAVLLLLEEAIMTCVWIMTTICGESLGDETDMHILHQYLYYWKYDFKTTVLCSLCLSLFEALKNIMITVHCHWKTFCSSRHSS